MSVILEPSTQLTFHRPLTISSKEILTVKNPGSEPVTFKVKTTAPRQYSVRPNAGRIEPKSEVEVQVILQPFKEEPEADFKCKDKFLVQTAVIEPQFEDLPVGEMWSRVEAQNKEGIHQHKIKCVFLPASTQEQQETKEPPVSHQQASTIAAPVPVPTVPSSTSHEPAPVTNNPVSEPQPSFVAEPQSPPQPKPREVQPVAAEPKAPSVAPRSVQETPIVTDPSKSEPKDVSDVPKAVNVPLQAQPIVTDKVTPVSDHDLLTKELQEARDMVERLRKELAQEQEQRGLRERRAGEKTVPSTDAVHQHLAALESPQSVEGYPPQVVLMVAFAVFLVTYLFF
ncbi:PapD-like protein [Radiomyces spectabilis]|uniref:PapD-like protein n=1 Tax=Radiomyces spectabilis TaxID=64574 RepID=UPI002220EC06|nr:PapD-like protein [Radiomyces spectabilis]KAI8381549.1 PapD-like protein [Radiomyces spectabilis]